LHPPNFNYHKTNMKKIFTTALVALLGTGAFAQISQGTVSVQGSVNFGGSGSKYVNSPANTESISRSIHLFPSVGYFVQDGLELGLGLGLNQGMSKYKQDSGESRSKTQSISFSPYIRKYITLTDQLQLHGTGYVTGNIGNSKYKDLHGSSYEETSTSSGYGLGFSPGLTYFATPKLGLTATFGAFSYSRSKNTPKNNPHQSSPYSSSSFTADLTPSSINIGIGYFIAR
jgi:hypothetical protein